MSDDWRRLLVDLDAAGTPHVVVTVIEALGSTPREAGAKMIVTAEATFGSIGGGVLEFQAIDTARRLFGTTAPVVEKIMLGADADQCCGGGATLLFEPFAPPRLTLALFGAGHVAQALVRVLEGVPLRLIWVDERADSAAGIIAPEPEAVVPDLPAGAQCLVMTHSHARDYALVEALLRRPDLGRIGLIGSKTKWARFRKRLAEAGVPAEAIGRVTCPIGLPGLSGKRPAEIAISVAADLLLHSGPENP